MSGSQPPGSQRVRASGRVHPVVQVVFWALLALAAVGGVTSLYTYFVAASRDGQNDAFATAAAILLGGIALAVGLGAGLGVYLLRSRSGSGPPNSPRGN